MDSTGAVGAARAAGVANKDFETLESAFSENEKVLTYYPLTDKQQYKDAYDSWVQYLENRYK